MGERPDYGLRAKDADGVTVREKSVLRLRLQRRRWAEIARLLGVTKERVNQVRKNLIVKGLLTELGYLTKRGKETVNAEVDRDDGAA